MVQKELVSSVLFTITTPKFESLGINLSKVVKDLYTENYKTLKKVIQEIKEKNRNGKIFYFH